MKFRVAIKILYLLFLVRILPDYGFAQGETGLTFLKIGVGARSIAMADASVVTAHHSASLYYNPAIIAGENRTEIAISHNQWIQDLTTQYLGAVIPLEGCSIGILIGLTSIDGIEIRRVPGDPEGTFTSRNLSTGLTFALPMGDLLELGITAKYLFEKIYVDAANGYAFDLGIRYRPFESGVLRSLQTGATVANIGQMSALRNEESNLPSLARVGIAFSTPVPRIFGDLTLEANGVRYFNSDKVHLNFGAEIDYSGLIFLRTGYQTGYEIRGFSMGIGVAYSLFSFDYAFIPFSNDFGYSHTFSISISF